MNCVSGMLFAYYHICSRKLWYVSHDICMEENSDNVQIGKLIDEGSYAREHKHIMIDERACIDFMRDKTVFEIKKSSAEKDAAIAQLQYYLYVLREKGVETTGELRVPTENFIQKVTLTTEDAQRIEQELIAIQAIMESKAAPPACTRVNVCRKCAFYELCYI